MPLLLNTHTDWSVTQLFGYIERMDNIWTLKLSKFKYYSFTDDGYMYMYGIYCTSTYQ